MILLSDKRIQEIKCIDNNERIISLRDRHEKISIKWKSQSCSDFYNFNMDKQSNIIYMKDKGVWFQ